MSIATREAAELYPLKDSFTEHGNERTNLRREGYVAGRTAPVTEEEIEAAARKLYDHEGGSWSSLNDDMKGHCRYRARIALSAARKQVSDE